MPGTGGALADLFVRLTLKDEMSGALDKAVQSTSTTAGRLQAVAPAAMAAGAALGAVGTGATLLIDSNRAMDASFATTALSMGVNADAVKELARGLQSVDSPIEEVAGTLDILARAGMKNVDQLGATASAFDNLADGIGQPADKLTQAMVPAFNALGIELEKAPRYIDGLATTFRTANVDMSDFSTMMTRVGPDLGEMGIGLQDVEAILMSFAERGITGRKATTELTQAIKASGGSTSELYKSLGMTNTELAGYKAKLDGSAGAAQKFADAQNSQFGTMDKLGFAFTTMKQTLGDVLKPFEGVAAALMAIGPGIAMALPGVLSLVSAIGAGGGLAACLGTAAAGAGTFAAGLLAIATGPIGLIVAGIAAVGAAIYLLDQKFHFIGPTVQWFKDTLSGIGEWLGSTFGPIISGVAGFFGELFSTFETGKGPVESILGAFKWFGETLAAAGKAIGEQLTPAIQGAATWIGEKLGPVIKDVAGWMTGTLLPAFEGVAKWAGEYIVPALTLLGSALLKIGGLIAGNFANQIRDFVSILGTVWTSLGGWFESISGGRSVLEVLATGFGILWQYAGAAWDKLIGFASWLGSTFKPIIDPVAKALGWIADRMGWTGESAATATPKIEGAGTAIANTGNVIVTAAAQAASVGPQYDEMGNYIEGSGIAAANATPQIQGAGTVAATAGTNATTGASGFDTLGGSIATAGTNANTLALNLGAVETAYANMSAAFDSGQAAVGPVTPSGEYAHPITTNPYVANPTSTPAQNWSYANDPSGSIRQSTEGPAVTTQDPSTVIVGSEVRDGYWWWFFQDGHKVRGPAYTAPFGTGDRTIPHFAEGGIYAGEDDGLAFLSRGEAVLTPKQQETVAGAIGGGLNDEAVSTLKQIADYLQQLIGVTQNGAASIVRAQKSDTDISQAMLQLQNVRLAQRGGSY